MISNSTLSTIYDAFLKADNICTDTRKIQKNDLFFALKGDNFNGNKFAKKAIEAGASFAIIDEEEFHIEGKTFLVDNVLTSLQQLANHHRNQFDIPVIGITGTNGKTTTKELVNVVLSTSFKTHCTSGNFNNHIGVPLTLLAMPLDTEIAIIEMGANKEGDIRELCDIALPNYGIITNIGKAHLEGFGSVEVIARTKSELFRHLLDNKGIAFVNQENENVARMGARFSEPLTYSFSNPNNFCYGELVEVNPYIKLSFEEFTNQQTQLIGKYNFENILAALAVAKKFKVETRLAIEAVKNYSPTNNRSQVIDKDSNKILLDAYIANPTSMQAAVSNFISIKHNQKVVILGDMFELGETSKEEHINLFKTTLEAGFKSNFFIGKHFKDALPQEKNVFLDKLSFIEHLTTNKIENSLVLIKGSRGIGLEDILDHL